MTTTNTNKTVLSKRNLELATTLTEKPYGTAGKTLFKFGAIDRSLPEDHAMSGKSIPFTVFNPSLSEHLNALKKGAAFVADYEVRQRPGTEYGPDFTVAQIYVDGAPVSQKQQRGGNYGRSPESIRLEYELKATLQAIERRSIEGQTGAKEIGQLLHWVVQGNTLEGCGVDIDAFQRLQGKYWQAVEKMVDNFLENRNRPAPTRQKAPDKPQDAKPGPTPAEPVSKDPDKPSGASEGPATFKNVGELLTAAAKLDPPVTRAEVFEINSVNDPKEITDLAGAWDTVLKYHASRTAKGKGTDDAWEDLGKERDAK